MQEFIETREIQSFSTTKVFDNYEDHKLKGKVSSTSLSLISSQENYRGLKICPIKYSNNNFIPFQ